MLRFLMIVLAASVLAGCQSRYGGAFGSCGTRVPPPATGSYGVPNTYYPNVTPRASIAPAIAPTALSSSQGTWRSVASADDSATPAVAATSALDNEITGSSVRMASAASASAATVPARTTKTNSRQIRLRGMPVNEVRSPVAPATFLSPATDSETPAGDEVETK